MTEPLVRRSHLGIHFTDPAVLDMRERAAEARKLGHATRLQPSRALARDMRVFLRKRGDLA